MSVFDDPSIASSYDAYYQEEFGRRVDRLEKRLLGDLLDHVPRGSLLELGCGTGHWSAFFLDLGFRLTGLDSSPAMLRELASKQLDMDYQLASALAIPFGDGSCDAVAAVTVLEFVDNRDRVFDEIDRVLAPGGYLILGCLNADSALARSSAGDPVFGGARFMNPGQLRQRLLRFGRPQLAFGVYLADDFSVLDDTPEQAAAEPAFTAAVVRKEP